MKKIKYLFKISSFKINFKMKKLKNELNWKIDIKRSRKICNEDRKNYEKPMKKWFK